MKNDFDEIMRKQTDIELIKILNSAPGDYQPAALEAAKSEFESRSLPEEQINAFQNKIQEKKQTDEAKANEPLATVWKILSFVFPGVVQIMFAGTFKADGYERKFKELIRWTLYGLAFYVVLIVLIFALE